MSYTEELLINDGSRPPRRPVRGDTIPITIANIVDLAKASVTNLTGWKCVFMLKGKLSDTEARITKSTALTGDNALTVVGAAFTGEIKPAESAALTPGVFYPFDVQLVSPEGRVMTPIRMSLVVDPDVNTVNA